MSFLSSDSLAIHETATVLSFQQGEFRCIKACVVGGAPVDEVCATAVDRWQDELDRRASGVPLPAALVDLLMRGYGRTGPVGHEDGDRR